jgi:lipoprotein-anchoring transpeptidase ErfK/SrfK
LVVLDFVEVDVASKQICLIANQAKIKCASVSVGCPSTPTIKGTYRVSTIYTNPIPTHPITGQMYAASKLGNYVITLKDTNQALHGWDQQSDIGQKCSLGCVRIPQDLLEDLVFNYLFNEVLFR